MFDPWNIIAWMLAMLVAVVVVALVVVTILTVIDFWKQVRR